MSLRYPLRRPLRAGIAAMLTLAFVMLHGVALARSCAEEIEPNDELHLATALGDANCLVGSLDGDDTQDAFLWEVTGDEALLPWTVSIEGIPGQMTKLDLVRASFADDGVNVTAADRLWDFATTGGQLTTSESILLPPGPLYLGVSKSGGTGRYVVLFEPGDRSLGRDYTPYERIREAESAFGAYGTLENDVPREIAWTVTEADAERLWGVEGRTSVDGSARVELIGPGGPVAAGDIGPEGAIAMGFLGLAPGTYTLRIDGEAGVSTLRTFEQGRPADGAEVEPNDSRSEANPMRLGESFEGVAERTDWIVVNVPEERAGEPLDLVLEADDEVEVALLDANGEELLERRGSSGRVEGLVLGAGTSYLRVEGRGGVGYRLALEPGSAPRDGFEVEPNDVRGVASPMAEDATLRGYLALQDTDVMTFEVEEAGLWRVQAIGDGVGELVVFDGGGRRLARTEGEGRIRLDNVVLAAGPAYVEVSGNGEGQWAVRALRTGDAPEPPPASQPAANPAPLAPPGEAREAAASEAAALADPGPPPPPGWVESEPNDVSERSMLLPIGTTRVGTLFSGDRDVYRFTLEHDGYVRIEGVPPADASLFIDVIAGLRATGTGAGTTTTFEGWLLAGDYDVTVRFDGASDGWYQLRATLLDPIALPIDAEPNDDERQAAALPADLRVVGTVGTMRDEDVYRLPVFDAPTVVEVRGDVGDANASLIGEAEVDRGADDVLLRATLPAGGQGWLRLRGRGSYDVQFAFDREPDPAQLRAVPGGSPLDLAATVDSAEVAAYWGAYQTVRGELTLTNPTSSGQNVQIEAHASRQPIEIVAPADLRVEAGSSATVPFEIVLPDDLRDDQPLSVTLAARNAGELATTTLDLAPICEAAPVGEVNRPRVPAELAGHLNVAWAPFGATIVGEPANNDVYLNDGWTSPGRGATRAAGEAFVLDLPGDDPITLSGTLLHPQSRDLMRQLASFRIETSLDGESWQPVLADRLDAARVEQAFVFDRPVEARYARLVMIDAHEESTRNDIWVGEWKMVSPDWRPAEPIDLADSRFGGILVWSDPLVGANAVLPDVGVRATFDGRVRAEVSYVVGFHHGRAARIDRLGWVASDRADANAGLRRVRVDVSLEGPVGPWTELGAWDVDPARDARTEMALNAPVWARYVRFTAAGHDPERGTVYGPAALHVYEAATTEDVRSALGAWGHNRPYGPYEAARAEAAADTVIARVDDDGSDDALDGARPLADGNVVRGTVLVAEDEDWWRIDVPSGVNQIVVRLAIEPGIVQHQLTDANGAPIPHDVAETEDGVRLTAFVEPGTYHLHLVEPKRNVVFAWDSSGSMGPFLPITNASVAAFARELDADREVAQLLSFASPKPLWLLPWWSGDPAYVERYRAAFDPDDVRSSDAELAMVEAVTALGQREGTRAILLITDHESPAYDLTTDLWNAIDQVRPRIFSFEVSSGAGVSSGGSGVTQDRMQAYAAANRGVYDNARNTGDFEAGYRRASCHMRRPKPYEIQVALAYAEPPGPGTLTVERGEGATLPGVQVIFDASGSMGALLPDGASRIDAARQVLDTLVDEVLPEGAPFALRAFGHLTPQSCESRLEVPLAPLDREAAYAAIDAIQPKLLSQTPIADALRQVATDLEGGGEGGTVILITDGEESCGGDPAAAVDELRAAGIDVRLAIVTLGVESEEVRARFEALAQRAGGTFASAGDTAALRAEVEAALHPSFEVLGPDGTVVATGRVGSGSVELPVGVYAVRVAGAPPTLIRDVRIRGDDSVSVRLGGE